MDMMVSIYGVLHVRNPNIYNLILKRRDVAIQIKNVYTLIPMAPLVLFKLQQTNHYVFAMTLLNLVVGNPVKWKWLIFSDLKIILWPPFFIILMRSLNILPFDIFTTFLIFSMIVVNILSILRLMKTNIRPTIVNANASWK